MNWPAYPAYEQSGVEWLGEIPVAWRKFRLKHFASTIPGGTPDTDNPSYWSENGDGTPWVSIGDMSRRDEVRATSKSVTAAGLRAKGLQVGVPGTVLFAMYASVGEVSVLRVPASWNQALLGFKVDERLCRARFLFYSLQTVRGRLPSLYRSNTQNNLNADQVENLALVLPSLPEQSAIVDFLDEETSKVDRLIAKQEQLIATLREGRTATITHTVTKGLNPEVEMKESGVDWLGEIPVNWSLDKFRYIFQESDERNGVHIVGDMLAISGYRGVEVKKYDSDDLKRSEEDLAKYRVVRRGQLAINTMWLNYGGLGVSKIEGHMSPDYKAYWIRPGFSHDYLDYLLRSSAYIAGYTSLLTGVRPNSLRIGRDSLMSLPVIMPPMHAQHQIVDALGRETARIDELIAKAEEVIATMQEYRSALITDAVTGKIDVREAA